MVRVYLDEDVSVLLATLLTARNIDAITARDERMLGLSDETHLHHAIQTERIFITHNRVDFENLHSDFLEKAIPHPGIIILSRKRDVYSIAHRLIKFFSIHQSLHNQLWYL